MVTLKDIAKKCGVSVASVSKAINHMPGVGAQTAKKIRETAKSMGYLPNAAAQALKTNRTFIIGVLLEDDDSHGLLHQFFVSVLDSFKFKMEEQGYDLMLMNRTVGKRTISYLEHCRYSNMDGVFVACIDFSDPELLELADAGTPMVTIDHTYPGHPSVYSDNVDGIRKAVRYAHEKGHTRIAFISGAPAGVTNKRYEGYEGMLKELGIPVREEYYKVSRYRDVKLTKELTAELLTLPEPPTCILMPDDYAGLGGLAAIREAGLRVPEDISVIGFDGLEYMAHISPRLTTVYQDVKRIGEAAAELLLKRIDNKEKDTPAKSIKVPVSLIEGETVVPPQKS
ncbi:MAG: LacI family DNA-binding transcriptional regulator [Christensenellales bacterium]|jgi:LacI family transcriptional regulator|nr:LacI family transcriptional regulator [Clostridiales bacterium]